MSILALPVLELYKAIERPVATDVVKQLTDVMGLDKNILISFPGKSEAMPLYDSRLGQDKNADSAQFKSTSKVSITVTEEYESGTELCTVIRSPDAPLLFEDIPLGIEMYPVYSPTTVQIEFTYRCASRREAEVFRDHYRARLAEGTRQYMFSGKYQMVIPKEYVLILQAIHKRREAQGGYGETWAEWMRKLHPKSTILTTLAGTEPLLTFDEEQVNIFGYWDFELPNEPSKTDVGSMYELNMTYKYTYDKPFMMVLKYPNIVHNQVLPKRFVQTGETMKYGALAGDRGGLTTDLEAFRNAAGYYYDTLDGIRQPFWDDFVPKLQTQNLFNVVTMLVRVDPLNPRHLINLSEFAPYRPSESVLEALQLFRSTCTAEYGSPFIISLFEDGQKRHPLDYGLTETGDVVANYDLDIRKTYRVSLSLVINPTVLAESTIEKLLNNPVYGLAYLDTLRPLSSEPDYEIKVLAKRKIDAQSWWYFVRTLRTPNAVYRNNRWGTWALICKCTVVTRRT